MTTFYHEIKIKKIVLLATPVLRKGSVVWIHAGGRPSTSVLASLGLNCVNVLKISSNKKSSTSDSSETSPLGDGVIGNLSCWREASGGVMTFVDSIRLADVWFEVHVHFESVFELGSPNSES